MQVVAEAKIASLNAAIEAHAPWAKGVIFSGLYADVSPNWYRYVGGKLFLIFYVQIAFVLLKSVINFAIDRWTRARAHTATTQPDMNLCASAPLTPRLTSPCVLWRADLPCRPPSRALLRKGISSRGIDCNALCAGR